MFQPIMVNQINGTPGHLGLGLEAPQLCQALQWHALPQGIKGLKKGDHWGITLKDNDVG
jgi:hypothetical protein